MINVMLQNENECALCGRAIDDDVDSKEWLADNVTFVKRYKCGGGRLGVGCGFEGQMVYFLEYKYQVRGGEEVI